MNTRFDWRRFCERYHISFVTSGPNVGRGNIGIHCPFCGAADPSEHMGLSLNIKSPAWGCLRNAKHRGRHPAWLVQRLLNVSREEAFRMVEAEAPPVDEFEASIQRLFPEPGDVELIAVDEADQVSAPPEFRNFSFQDRANHYQRRFIQYIASRGFGTEALSVAKKYGLWWAITGPQQQRIIFPVRDEKDRLIGWTGRAIINPATIRYKAMPSMGKDIIMAFPSLREPVEHLVLCEGPFDALKIDHYGRGLGLAAVALMGTAVTPAQVAQLIHLQGRVPNLWVLFDTDATAQSLALTTALDGFAGTVRFVPLKGDYSDPGEMSATDARNFCKGLTSRN